MTMPQRLDAGNALEEASTRMSSVDPRVGRTLVSLAFAITALPAIASGQSPALVVDGAVETRLTLSLDDLKSMGRARVEVDRQGGRTTYEGVPLVEVLRRAGVNIGRSPLQGSTITSVLIAAGADGFNALFALAELDPVATDRRVIVADVRDGRALSADEGPLRLVAPGDRYPLRWIRNLARLTVAVVNPPEPRR